MNFLEPYLRSALIDSSGTFINNQECGIDCSERESPQKVSFGMSRDIVIRVSIAFLEYQAVILHYRDYGNR